MAQETQPVLSTEELGDIPGVNEAAANYRTLIAKYKLDIALAFDTIDAEHNFVPQILPVVEEYEPKITECLTELLSLIALYRAAE